MTNTAQWSDSVFPGQSSQDRLTWTERQSNWLCWMPQCVKALSLLPSISKSWWRIQREEVLFKKTETSQEEGDHSPLLALPVQPPSYMNGPKPWAYMLPPAWGAAGKRQKAYSQELINHWKKAFLTGTINLQANHGWTDLAIISTVVPETLWYAVQFTPTASPPCPEPGEFLPSSGCETPSTGW